PGEQLERVEDVHGQIAQTAAPRGRRGQERAPLGPAEMGYPRVENPGGVSALATRRPTGGRIEPERLGQLRDVQDRRCAAVDHPRRDDRPPRPLPARLTLATVSGVQRLELDAALAKELPGRRAASSGRVPEESDSG